MIAVDTQSFVGLCETCNNAPSCFHHARRGPALFCEMFDDYVSPDATVAARTAVSAQRPFLLRHTEKEPVRQAGLCVNCEHASHCGHAKVEGGVWHCEDYE